jgi:hypothetical protein
MIQESRTKLQLTQVNIDKIKVFLDETRNRMMNGQELIFQKRSVEQLELLSLDFGITRNDVYTAILNLKTDDYYRGIDPSDGNGDFDVCTFSTCVGKKSTKIYLKYGLRKEGLEILVFSNHEPKFVMNNPLKR